MDEHQRITFEYLKSILHGYDLSDGAPIEYLVYALKVSKNEAEKELTREIYQKTNELLLLESSYEFAEATKERNVKRRKAVKLWLADVLKTIEKTTQKPSL